MELKAIQKQQASELYNELFASNKVRKWLSNNGVKDLDEVNSLMIEDFLKSICNYTYDKIQIEKFVFHNFKYRLYNYYEEMNALKRSSASNFTDMETDEGDCFEILDVYANHELDPFNIDLDLLNLDNIDSFIVTNLINGLNLFEIRDKLGMNSLTFHNRIEKIGEMFNKYNLGLL